MKPRVHILRSEITHVLHVLHCFRHPFFSRLLCFPQPCDYTITQGVYGNINKAAADAIESVGYLHIVQWDVSQTDAKKAIKDVDNGSILLFHARKRIFVV